MIETIKIYGRPEGCICDIVAYLPNKKGYPTVSDMNKLGEIGRCGLKERLKKKKLLKDYR